MNWCGSGAFLVHAESGAEQIELFSSHCERLDVQELLYTSLHWAM